MDTILIDQDAYLVNVVQPPAIFAKIADRFPLTPLMLCFWLLADSCNRGGRGRLDIEYSYSDSPGNLGGKINCTSRYTKYDVYNGRVTEGETEAQMVWTTVSGHVVTFEFDRNFATVNVAVGDDESGTFYPIIRDIISSGV